MADDKAEDPPAPAPAPVPHIRWRRSAENLATTRSELPALLAEFAGLPAPSGALADKLITHILDTLDGLVPIGAVRTANDLVDATRDLGLETFPPIPNQIAAARAQINDAISRLETPELHSAATQLGLQRDVMEWGVRAALARERRLVRQQAAELLADVDFDEVGYPDADSDDHEGDYAAFGSAVESAVHDLRAQRSTDWGPIQTESLRCAVALHLAQIGDAFLQTSER